MIAWETFCLPFSSECSNLRTCRLDMWPFLFMAFILHTWLAAGETMVPISWTELQCPVTGQIEQRKVAKIGAWPLKVEVAVNGKRHPGKKPLWKNGGKCASVNLLAIAASYYQYVVLVYVVFRGLIWQNINAAVCLLCVSIHTHSHLLFFFEIYFLLCS